MVAAAVVEHGIQSLQCMGTMKRRMIHCNIDFSNVLTLTERLWSGKVKAPQGGWMRRLQYVNDSGVAAVFHCKCACSQGKEAKEHH